MQPLSPPPENRKGQRHGSGQTNEQSFSFFRFYAQSFFHFGNIPCTRITNYNTVYACQSPQLCRAAFFQWFYEYYVGKDGKLHCAGPKCPPALPQSNVHFRSRWKRQAAAVVENKWFPIGKSYRKGYEVSISHLQNFTPPLPPSCQRSSPVLRVQVLHVDQD